MIESTREATTKGLCDHVRSAAAVLIAAQAND